ncbi:MAG: alpha/beta fold hydrolase, partial [Roseiflexaceae bacterium]|nr:alpha/beta fold hydrolase [Roseiflexaceae bacterium]
MLRNIVQSLLIWLALFEYLAAARELRGLSWRSGRASRWALALVPLLLVTLRGRWRARLLALLLGIPLALFVQILGANARNRTLSARERLLGGIHERAGVTRLDIPMDEGFLPALHIVPAGGADKAVLVLHGSGCDKTFYAWPLIDALRDAGCATLLVDLDGHGENPRAQRFPQILDDARVAVAWLRERYARVGVVGLSLGGCIAARAA